MTFLEAFNRYNLPMFGDIDKDKVPNVFDCKPFDPDRDGLFGRAINVITLGKHGQSKEEYETEKTLKRVERKKVLEAKIEQQKAINAMIEQQIKLRKLQAEKQKLVGKKRAIPKPSIARQAISLMVGVPIPPPRPGYYVERIPPKLPPGYQWKKIPKSKKSSKKPVNICPSCGTPMVLVPSLFGPIWQCPRCTTF